MEVYYGIPQDVYENILSGMAYAWTHDFSALQAWRGHVSCEPLDWLGAWHWMR